MNKDDKAPAGNAKMGDRVWLRFKKKRLDPWGPWKRGYTVTKVGLKNEHGYRLNIQVKGKGVTLDVSPFRNHGERGKDGKIEPDILIIPPESEYARIALLLEFLENNPIVMCVRDPCNSETARYVVVCTKCGEPLSHRISEVSDATIHIEADGRFWEGKPSTEDCFTETICGCKDNNVYNDFPEVQQYT